MITHKQLMEWSAKAQDLFPMSPEQAVALHMTGDRRITLALSEERVLWMLQQAYELGKKEE